ADGTDEANAATHRASRVRRIAHDFNIAEFPRGHDSKKAALSRFAILAFGSRLSRIRTDAAADERGHEPAPKLVADLPLIQRLRLEFDSDGSGAIGQRFDTDDL